MLKTVVAFVLLGSFVGSIPSDLEDQLGLFSDDDTLKTVEMRAVANPKTPNQILDAIVEGAFRYITAAGWDSSKNVQNGESTFPLNVNNGGNNSEKLSITSASLTGLGFLTRSRSASFNADKSVLTGTVKVADARALADYSVDFAGTGEAPAHHVSGQVTERLNNLFVDIEVNLVDLVPQSIKSYTVRSGHDVLNRPPTWVEMTWKVWTELASGNR